MTTKSTDPSRPISAWSPTVDGAECAGCGTCIDFCHNDVYAWADERVVVAHKTNCVVGCSHCAMLCEVGAISFPTLEDIKRARRQG